MVKTKENDGSTDSGEEQDRNDDNNSKSTSKCAHINKSVVVAKIKKLVKNNGLMRSCVECEKDKLILNNNKDEKDDDEDGYDESLWLCLKCGAQLCGRARNKHALQHYEKLQGEMHAINVNTTTFMIWCYECDDELSEESHKKLLDCVSSVRKAIYDVDKNPLIPTQEEMKQKLMTGIQNVMAVSNDNSSNSVESAEVKKDSSEMSVSYNFTLPKKNNQVQVKKEENKTNSVVGLPRVRGLSNLGNTCFFNAIVQNLSQTPYLLENLEEAIETGKKFELSGGSLKLNDNETIELDSIKGELGEIGAFTKTLYTALEAMQMSGGVFTPRDLLNQFTTKWPQFSGGDQHDSHEALRHLLESCRTEDLRRYQLVVLRELGYGSNTNPKNVREDDKKKILFYGRKAEDRILHPEPVFRGYLVSTLTCQECNHISPRQEYFLDISLPVTADKPQPPTRRKTSPEPTFVPQQPPIPTKSQIKRERKAERKAKRNASKQNRKGGAAAQNNANKELQQQSSQDDQQSQSKEDISSNSSPLSDSDADVEDNLTDEKQADANGNQLVSPQNPEKVDDMPENPFKAETEGKTAENIVCEMSLSSSGVATLNRQFSKLKVDGNEEGEEERANSIKAQQKKCQQRQRERLTSHMDWSNTLAPRLQCSENELSLQSCLNSFTSVELMTGSNKVGCEACTERINGKKGKTVYTTATKQFLISSPPAVLIVHLKRFQVGMRGMFRKITKHVSFPTVLDIAPFCASKVKLLHHVKRHQKKILYSLYGVVEHSGGMFGGHYVAYVKVRPKLTRDDPRWKFLAQGAKTELDQLDEQKIILEKQTEKVKKRQMSMTKDSDDSFSTTSSSQTSDEEETACGGSDEPENENPPSGKWYYVSDSHVRETTESDVLNAQAYLLFYERIF